MIKQQTITASDGVRRTVEYKLFDNEVRVYRVHGDITNNDAIAEIAQMLAIEHKREKVQISI